ESKLARVSRPGKVARAMRDVARRTCGAGKHERGGSANLRCKKWNWLGLADLARLQEARARWLGELAVQEMELARVSRPGKVARGTSEVAWRTCGAGRYARPSWQTRQGCKKHRRGGPANLRGRKTGQGCKRHERGGSANLLCRKVSSHGLADPARLQGARARWLGEFAVQKTKLTQVRKPDKVAKGMNEVVRRTCGAGKKVISNGIADPARLQEARARWLGEFAVQKTKLTQTWQGCKRRERGGSTNLRCRKVSSHGLADLARLQEARAWWLYELAVQESKLARVSRPGKVARGASVVALRTCGAGKKVSSHGLADLARLQEARAWWLYELAVQESKLARVSRPGKVARGASVVALRTCGAGKKVSSHGLADLARLQEARAWWLYELAVQESKLARVSRPGKVARGASVVALRTCGAGKKVSSHGLADLARLQEARAWWLYELAVQESKLARVSRPGKVARGASVVALRTCGAGKKVSSHGLADLARLQEARAWWLYELAVQESKLARVSRPGKVARGASVVALRTCGAGKKVSSHGLADLARLQEARAWWLYELAVQESKLARVSRPGKVARGASVVALRTCGAGKKVSSHGLADLARLQEARAWWLYELAVQESKLARVSRPGKVARGASVVALRTCGAGKKVSSHGLADLARLQEARAWWLYELAVQESKLARVSRPGKVARGASVVALRTCGAGKKVSSHGLADLARLQEARAWWLYELAVQESKLARVSRPGKVARGASVVALRTCGAGKKVSSHGLADLARLQEARAWWLYELAVQESKLARVSRPGKVARGASVVALRTCGAGK
ncbi:hypothetical protein CRG98_044505, partial [Punica granatum]